MPGGLNILTIRLMPESPSVDLAKVRADAETIIRKLGIFNSAKEEPVAFGLKAVIIIAGLKEDKSPNFWRHSWQR